jgi:hypothetical protein
MSTKKQARTTPRNNVARGMIMAGTGRGKVLRDRRCRRPKDARQRREWSE